MTTTLNIKIALPVKTWLRRKAQQQSTSSRTISLSDVARDILYSRYDAEARLGMGKKKP